MSNNKDGFSLIIVVIFMSIAALFVGYIMGSWLISFMTEEPNQQMVDDNQDKTETVEEVSSNELSTDNSIEADEENIQQDNSNDQKNTEAAEEKTESKTEQSTELSHFERDDLSGTFAVQVGAFNNIDSAISLKNEMEDLGFEAFITESKPHKIRVGTFATREEAEETEVQLKTRNYEGFIVLRD